MDKKEWLEILKLIGERDAFDWITLVVEIISPILLLISIIISFKAAKASRKSVELNKKVYEDQKHERELSFLPLFQTLFYSNYVTKIQFKLKNKNEKEIYIQNAVSESPHKFEFFEEENDNVYYFELVSDSKYQSEDYIKVWLYYITLDHKNYCTKLTLQIFNGSLIIKEQEHTRREKNILVPQQ
ncbi:hypothetical protein ACW2QC_20230 [Virgibacillus sp. FSP13]